MAKPELVVLTGAGISAESGIRTFRDAGGLWEDHDIMEVASPQGWAANPQLVLQFYNERRAKLREVEPNAGHQALARLEAAFDVTVITQNVDDLHERGGSTRVLHLHGELLKSRSSVDPSLVYDCTGDIGWGDTCAHGSQLRPHIVWFGEAVPLIESAMEIASRAERFLVVGTSMEVYPAASLIHYVPNDSPKYLVDPNIPNLPAIPHLETIAEPATVGLPPLVDRLLAEA